MPTTSRRSLVTVTRVVGGVVAAGLLLAACSDTSGTRNDAAAAVSQTQAGGGGWSTLAIQANYVERYETLAEMGMKADVVVIAQATGVDGIRRMGGEGMDGTEFAQVRFKVIRAVSDWGADSVVVEFDAVMSLKALEEQVAGFPPAVLLLREKGTREEAGLYRLVNGQALWTEQPEGGLFAPLLDNPLDTETFASELVEMKGLEDLGDHLESSRRECEPECGRGPRPTPEPTGG